MRRKQLAPVVAVRGDTLPFIITLEDVNTEAPVDLTGTTILCQIRESADEAAILATASVTLIDVTGGKFRLEFSAADTSTLPLGVLRFDIQFTFPDGTVRTMWANRKLKVVADVSR